MEQLVLIYDSLNGVVQFLAQYACLSLRRYADWFLLAFVLLTISDGTAPSPMRGPFHGTNRRRPVSRLHGLAADIVRGLRVDDGILRPHRAHRALGLMVVGTRQSALPSPRRGGTLWDAVRPDNLPHRFGRAVVVWRRRPRRQDGRPGSSRVEFRPARRCPQAPLLVGRRHPLHGLCRGGHIGPGKNRGSRYGLLGPAGSSHALLGECRLVLQHEPASRRGNPRHRRCDGDVRQRQTPWGGLRAPHARAGLPADRRERPWRLCRRCNSRGPDAVFGLPRHLADCLPGVGCRGRKARILAGSVCEGASLLYLPSLADRRGSSCEPCIVEGAGLQTPFWRSRRRCSRRSCSLPS